MPITLMSSVFTIELINLELNLELQRQKQRQVHQNHFEKMLKLVAMIILLCCKKGSQQ